MTTPPRGQLLPLLALRWRMIRSRPLRGGLVALATLPVVMVLVGMEAFSFVPAEQAFNIALATPTLYLAFVVLTILAPLAAGGGYELYPSEQLIAYPVTPRTVFRSTLLLAPINLAWILNVVALLVVTSVATEAAELSGIGVARSSLSVLAFVALATVTGHAIAWLVVGIRQTRRGRRATWALAVVLALAVVAVLRLGYGFTLLDRSPTRYALLNALDGYSGRMGSWSLGLAVMLAGAAVALSLGRRATAWTLRRPGDHAVGDSSRPVTRRTPRPTVLRELLAVDRASVWRSVPLRRGIVVLLLLPGAVAAIAGLSWQSLVLLPGLVAAGSGLLFGINAFCLDASGSTWLSTLPRWPDPAFVAKAWVVTEITLMAVAAAILGGALRTPTPASAADVTATLACALAATALVVASAMRSSVRHPHRADLRGPRDTPAPPGVMALYSMRLAVITTLTALLFSGFALSRVWWLPLVLLVPFLAGAGLSLIGSARLWEQPQLRARVVTTVSGG